MRPARWSTGGRYNRPCRIPPVPMFPFFRLANEQGLPPILHLQPRTSAPPVGPGLFAPPCPPTPQLSRRGRPAAHPLLRDARNNPVPARFLSVSAGARQFFLRPRIRRARWFAKCDKRKNPSGATFGVKGEQRCW